MVYRKKTMGSDGRNFSLTHFYDFYTRLNELEMLFRAMFNLFMSFYTFPY